MKKYSTRSTTYERYRNELYSLYEKLEDTNLIDDVEKILIQNNAIPNSLSIDSGMSEDDIIRSVDEIHDLIYQNVETRTLSSIDYSKVIKTLMDDLLHSLYSSEDEIGSYQDFLNRVAKLKLLIYEFIQERHE